MTMSKEWHKNYFKEYRIKNKDKIKLKDQEYSKTHREEINQTKIKWKRNNPERTLYTRIKSNAKTRGIEFSLVYENIVFPTHCPILNIELDYDVCKGEAQGNSPSFDRKDPNFGYTDDNVWVISRLANVMKNNATPEQLLFFGKWAVKTYERAEE